MWRRTVAALTVAFLAAAPPPSAWAQHSRGVEEAHHGDYRLDDGSVVFFSRVGNFARYLEDDRVIFLARRPSGVFASRLGDTITLVDTGRHLRVESPGRETRLGERVEPYREEEVTFRNGKVRLAGTLLLPPGPGPHPAIVFAEGAGRTTRHGFGRIFADHFARHGIAALLYDKRGAGESTGSYGAVIRDYGALAGDLLSGVRLLKSRTDIEPTAIGVRGTSEGGWVVALAAARSSGDISFVIGISAPARPGPQGVWEMQNKLRDAGVAEPAMKTMALASTQVLAAVRLLGLLPECCRDESFPMGDWERVHQPVLLVYGQLDKQVPPALSASTITEALRRGGNHHYLVQAFPGANHVIALASGFESEMRSAPAVQFAPGYLEGMVDWVRTRLGRQAAAGHRGWVPPAPEPLPDIEDPPWHASPALQLVLWAGFLAVFLATCAAPLLRRLLHRPRTPPHVELAVGRARRLAVVVSAAHLVVAAGLVALVAQFGAGEPLPGLWTVLRLSALAASLMALALVVATIRVWRRCWPAAARRRHGTVTVAAAAFVPFLFYWHLLP